MFRSLIFFSTAAKTLFSKEAPIYDLETLPLLRSIQYPKAPYEKIVVFSEHRCGSTLVYNILRYLFEDTDKLSCPSAPFSEGGTILKSHEIELMEQLKGTSFLTVFCIRYPMDAILSMCTAFGPWVKSLQPWELKAWTLYKIYNHQELLQYADNLATSGHNVIFLSYHDCLDLEVVINKISEHFHFFIAEEDQLVLKEALSKENVIANTAKLRNFQDVLPLSGYHGNHVTAQKIQFPDDLYSLLMLHYKNMDIFKKYADYLER